MPRIKMSAAVPPAGSGLKKGMRVRKPSPKEEIGEKSLMKKKPPVKNTGGGLPFFNPYGGR